MAILPATCRLSSRKGGLWMTWDSRLGSIGGRVTAPGRKPALLFQCSPNGAPGTDLSVPRRRSCAAWTERSVPGPSRPSGSAGGLCRRFFVLPAFEAEEHIQPLDHRTPLEYRRTDSRVELKPFHDIPGAAGARDLDPLRPRSMGHHRRLAGGERHRAGIEIQAALLAVEIVKVERPQGDRLLCPKAPPLRRVDRAVCPRPHEELAAADQVTAETEPPVFDRDPHLAEPRDEIFLHLTGHPRLLHSRKTGRVGVGIGRNGAV